MAGSPIFFVKFSKITVVKIRRLRAVPIFSYSPSSKAKTRAERKKRPREKLGTRGGGGGGGASPPPARSLENTVFIPLSARTRISAHLE